MSWWNRLTGSEGVNNRLGSDRAQINGAIADAKSGTGWENAFNQTAGAFLQNQMPSFMKSLQMTREDGVRRGISTGDLGTSTEGDLVSAFQRNIANTLGGMAMQGYDANQNRYLSLIGDEYDADQAQKNSQNAMWGQIFGSVSQLAGDAMTSGMFSSAPKPGGK